jgi:hypothetical protein
MVGLYRRCLWAFSTCLAVCTNWTVDACPSSCLVPPGAVSAGIERLIEVNESSSIFVRVDDDNTFMWRALITGKYRLAGVAGYRTTGTHVATSEVHACGPSSKARVPYQHACSFSCLSVTRPLQDGLACSGQRHSSDPLSPCPLSPFLPCSLPPTGW